MQNKINILIGKIIPMILILFVAANIFAKAPWENGKLKVSNGRFLQHENGTPFFWQGDTAVAGAEIKPRTDWKLFCRPQKESVLTLCSALFCSFTNIKLLLRRFPICWCGYDEGIFNAGKRSEGCGTI